MKKFAAIGGILLLAFIAVRVAWSSQPAVVAIVDVSKDTLYITNGNEKAWRYATIILNDGFDGPRLSRGPFAPGERVAIPLSEFVAPLNKQRFTPNYERVDQVAITVDGYQLGIYQTRQ